MTVSNPTCDARRPKAATAPTRPRTPDVAPDVAPEVATQEDSRAGQREGNATSEQGLEAGIRDWLPGYAGSLPGLSRAFAFLRDNGSGLRPIASWPGVLRCPPHAAEFAAIALSGRTTLDKVQGPHGSIDRLVTPITHGGKILGSLLCEADALSDADRHALLAALSPRTGASGATSSSNAPNHELEIVLDLLASCLDARSAGAAGLAFVTEIATRLGCDRVSLGRVVRERVRLEALSHNARIDSRSNLVRGIEGAMSESVEQGTTVRFPRGEAEPDTVDREHEALSRRLSGAHILTVPLAHDGALTGAVTLERHGPTGFDKQTEVFCESLAALAGPLLELRYRNDRTLIALMAERSRRLCTALLGPTHVGKKFAAAVCFALIAWLSVATGTHRVTATASLEGSVHRAIVAPMDGFVSSTEARAGDRLEAGAMLARLDARELELEQSKWRSELEQLRKQHRTHRAAHDRAQAVIVNAQMARAEAQLGLIASQLERIELRAPIAGLVVSGDLSQLLGSPVKRGEVLFEMAPLDDYRVVLEVDERDMAALREGMQGHVALEGMPDQRLAVTIERITPVATARDGRNAFRVEARLDTTTASALRPGMQGVAKIDAGPRRLVWIWTHRIVDWIRLQLWRWVP